MKKITTLIITLFITTIGFSQQIGDGFAPIITDFATPLKSGVYNGSSATGISPDISFPYQHLFVIRHPNNSNNYQLQISSSFSTNDRLFFRKIASENLFASNPTWVEIATRGVNSFEGDQNVKGSITSTISGEAGGYLSLINNSKTAPSIAQKWNIYNMTGIYGNSLQFWAYDSFASTGVLTGTNRFTIMDNGNVGIGTLTPSSNLEIIEAASTSVPAGQTAPTKSILKLSRTGTNGYSYNENAEFRLGHGGSSVYGSKLDLYINGGSNTNSVPDQHVMTWNYNGNVGIGMTNPNNKLDVNGTIHSKEVKVDMIGWSDFVFKKEYSLPTLAEVEKQINEKGHLENIPSEEEVLKNGINLGEMNAKLLQKIEELTLYLIDMKKENIEMKNRLLKLENK